MKKTKPILIFCLLSLLGGTCFGQSRLMSFNIRYDTPRDGENWWDLRKAEVVELLKYYQPDFLGLQEAMPNQRDYVADQLATYAHIGHGRDGLNTNSEGVPLFYKKDKFDLLESDLFWLSETPDNPSKGWDAALNRIVVYGAFKDKMNGETLHIFNCHFDHQGRVAREKSAEQLIKYIKTRKLLSEKIILMGDLNCLPTEQPISILTQYLQDSYSENLAEAYGPIGTFNAFDTEKILTQRIDYIFVRNVEVKSYRSIDDRRKNNLYPSDHLPVLIER